MASLISQDDACAQLRLDASALTVAQLADVNAKAEQASAIVVDYLKRPFIEGPLMAQPVDTPPTTDDDGLDLDPPTPWPAVPLEPWTQATLPTVVKAAMLVVLTALYDGRTPQDDLLSPAVTAILWRQRDPAIA